VLSAWRRATCGDLTPAFGFGEPLRLDLPHLPGTGPALAHAEDEVMSSTARSTGGGDAPEPGAGNAPAARQGLKTLA